MEADVQRANFAKLVAERGLRLARLSRVLGRNPAYLQQYLMRGSPRELPERDRARLAEYLGVDETVLGGRAQAALIALPRIDLGASAGPGGWAEEETLRAPFGFPPALLQQLGVRGEAASIVRVSGESMAPTLRDGDEVLVDRDRCRIDPRGIFVLRVEGELLVKRVRPAVGGVELVSDNPDYPVRRVGSGSFRLIGRVAWLGRAL
ncbi:S24 family peptidase [Sphingomonas sp. TDK1]|uniref:S24 family peptidase n=1 Tax=Sphingomonas sp. TDK1 TaxID=453247 RepID=UPI0007D9E373|nr:S24 family peptidase [Sphingomonas sp. TDK1]OAN58867.1 phage repressor protein [Sphingomonas sp. TDK1]